MIPQVIRGLAAGLQEYCEVSCIVMNGSESMVERALAIGMGTSLGPQSRYRYPFQMSNGVCCRFCCRDGKCTIPGVRRPSDASDEDSRVSDR